MTPLLSLESFRQTVLGMNPFHFWGLANDDVPVTAACKDLLKEYGWQDTDYVSRDDMRQAIENAEALLADFLGFYPAPKYFEQTVDWPRYFDNTRSRLSPMDATGRWIAPRLPAAGYLQAAGTELLTLVGTATKSNPPAGGDGLVFSDRDGDGLMDTFTITLATAEDEPGKLAVYFAAADRLDGAPVGAAWRIEPVSVSISSGTATIIGRIWTIVRPILYQGVAVESLDPGDITPTGPYAQSLEVYTRTTNPAGTTAETAQAMLTWETTPCHGWWCCCSGCGAGASYSPSGAVMDPAALATAAARATIRDSRLGLVGIGEAVYNASSGIWSALPWDVCAEPDRVTVRVLAGYPLENQQMAAKYRTLVARLAVAELARPASACEQANREMARWQLDLARSAGANDEAFGYISREDLSNPLGTRRGHVFAWKQIRSLRVTPGVTGF